MDHHRQRHHNHHHHNHNEFVDSRYFPHRPPPSPSLHHHNHQFHPEPNPYPRPPPSLPPPHPPSHHHHQPSYRHLPPAPSHPPPPQPQYRPPPPMPQILPPPPPLAQRPPPLSYNHHHSHPQRVHDVNLINSPPRHHYHNHHHHERGFEFPPSPRVPPNQGFVYDRHYPDDDRNRLYLPEPPRVSSIVSPIVPPISGDRDLEGSVHRIVDFNRMSPQFREIQIDGFRHHEIRSPVRFGDQFDSDHGIGLRPDELRDWRDDRRIVEDLDRERLQDHRFHDQYHPEMLPREFELNSGAGECVRGPIMEEVLIEDSRDGMMMDDEVNVSYGVQASQRDLPCSPHKFRNRDIDRDGGFQEFYEEGTSRGRYYDRGRKQDMQDYSRTLRKNFRKKSAFLRIQPLKHSSSRNRNDTTSSPHKGKESLDVLGHRSSEERGGSPVELDVSFKSNSLVAKAIMAAPSSSEVDPKDISSLNDPDVKINSESPSKTEGNRNCRDNSSGSRKVEKHGKIRFRISPTLKRVGLPSNIDKCDSNPESPSSGSSCLNGGSPYRGSPKGETSDKDDTSVAMASSPSIRKKRKTSILLSRLSSSPSETNANLANISCTANRPSDSSMSDECIKQTAQESSCGVPAVSSTDNEIALGTENMDVNEPPIVIVQAVSHTVSEAPSRRQMMKKGVSNSLHSSKPLGSRASEAPEETNKCTEEIQTMSNSEKDIRESVDTFVLDVSTEGGCHDSGFLGKSSEPLVSVGGNVDSVGILCNDQDKLGTNDAINSVSSPLDASMKMLDGVDASCTVVRVDKPCGNQVESFPEDSSRGQSCEEGNLVGVDNNQNEKEHRELLLSSSKIDVSRDKTSTAFRSDAAAVDSEKLTFESDHNVTKDIQEQQCQGVETLLGCGVDSEGPSKAFVSVGGGLALLSAEEDASGPTPVRKRKSWDELQCLKSKISESSHDIAGSKSFLMMKSILPEEKQGLTVLGLPCCTAESDVPFEKKLKASFPESRKFSNHYRNFDAIGSPPHKGKKAKVLPLESLVSDASASQNCGLPASTDCLNSMAKTTLNSVGYSAQLSEGPELSNTSNLEKKSVDGAANNLQMTGYRLAGGMNADLPDGNPCLSVCDNAQLDEKQSSYRLSKQEEDANLVIDDTVDESGSIALESEGAMARSYHNDGMHCMEIDQIGDADHEPLTNYIKHENNNNAVNVTLPSEPECLQLHAAFVDDGVTTARHIGNLGLGPVVADIECECNAVVDDDLTSTSDCPQLHAERLADGPTTALNDVSMQSNEGSSLADSLPTHSLHSSTAPTLNSLPDEKLVVAAKKSIDSLLTRASLSARSRSLIKSNEANGKPKLLAPAATIQPSAQKNVVTVKNSKVTTAHVNSPSRQLIRRNVLIRTDTPSASNTPVKKPSLGTAPSSKSISNYPAKPRTWRRTDIVPASNTPVKKPLSTVTPQRPPTDKSIKVHSTSYIRKGNSLVRNPASGSNTPGPRVVGASVNQSETTTANNIRKITSSPETTDSSVPPDRLMTGGRNTHVEMPRTPPLPCSSGMASDHGIDYLGDLISSPPIGQSEGIDEETTKSSETAPSSSRNLDNDVEKSLEDPGTLSDGNFPASDSKRIFYIKRKSNQLIAASNSSKSVAPNMDKAPALSSDNGYYKKRKNQLIRASSESNIQQTVAKINDSFNSLQPKAPDVYNGRNSTKRESNKAKRRKVSLVWKLGDTKSSSKGADPLRCGKLLSNLLPWKRATYWRSVWHSSTNSSSNSSLMITRKLLSSRKRAAVYVRSGRGFSLRRSKVISLAGTSLKWSKSMEKRSKKVDEDAAQAVTAMDSLNRPKTGGSGERIFRIGMFRYRMDPSRRALQRIADDVSSNSATSKPENGGRKTYVPKRLLIGSNEYVRIGNGNQLVRDPKRRTRLLASEKVRWSLHTARMRLAKKRKFCQFFTRFGKCNKGEGKCPFIHDPSKIAVCTKFLNGLCSDPSCKLTHKVIPERMPDCSFFLQGSCSNENCPYRHVNVNPKAPICANFLRGYCAEGNECRKKHSYICPEFEATGSCPQGSKCKLYHPKKGKGNSKKRKTTNKDQKNSRGRYFGSGLSITSEPETDVMADKLVAPKISADESRGELGDFISLDVSDDEFGGEIDSPTTEPMSFSEGEAVNSPVDDLDDLIRPLRILDRH